MKNNFINALIKGLASGVKWLLQLITKNKDQITKKQSEVAEFSTSREPAEQKPEPDVVIKIKWHPPIRGDKFSPFKDNEFLKYDAETYPATKHHPGVDYSARGENGVTLHFCANGEIIESGHLERSLGNYFCFYVPEVDYTFVYCHLRDKAPADGQYEAGRIAGIAGNTGKSFGIHLHLECIKGRKRFADRMGIYKSEADLLKAAEDGTIQNADTFIKSRLADSNK